MVLVGGYATYKYFENRKLKAHLTQVTEHNRVQNENILALMQRLKTAEDTSEELTFMQKNTILNQKSELDHLSKAHKKLQDKTLEVESRKKSSEVRLGLMAENFMPFIRDYPYDHKRFRFLANPVDGLQITDDAVIFIEFKTGAARLSRSQKAIKDLVAKGQVRFETFRVNDQGTSLKIESDMSEVVEPKNGE
jgi:predicted Holliday junction resolvase-like endonuclease